MRASSFQPKKKNGLAGRWSGQLDLFDNSVLEHTEVARRLCIRHAPKARCMMRQTYRQEWPAYNQAQVNEKSRFLELLFELCNGIEPPIQTFGRPRLPFAEMLFCAALKVYSGMSSRRVSSDLRDAVAKGYITKAPHFNSVSNYLEDERLTPYLKTMIEESARPLAAVEWDFAVDSSGFATGRQARWVDAKWNKVRAEYGQPAATINKRDWVKVHVMCGVKTNIITSVEVTNAHGADSPQFAPLLERTARSFPIQSVCADKAYSSEKNMGLVLLKKGMPYIAFRSNATAANRNSGSIWKNMFHFYSLNKERFMRNYHRRSNVETTFSMIKGKFGERLRSKSHTARVNEVLCKVLAHNLCCVIQSMYELDITPEFWAE